MSSLSEELEPRGYPEARFIFSSDREEAGLLSSVAF
jgi:hypothetical protein